MKLTDFGVKVEKHVFVCVTDGAIMMVKFWKIISSAHHMCYAHAIHLVVCDVLYKKRVYLTESANEFEADDIHESEEETNEFEELREDLSQTLDMVAGDITESDGNVSCSNMFVENFGLTWCLFWTQKTIGTVCWQCWKHF